MKKNWDISLPRVLATPLSLLASFLFFSQTSAQECPKFLSPNTSSGVSVNAVISWEAVTGVPGYILTLGTTPGGGEILNELNVGASTIYTPPLGLPESTEIFVKITLFFFNQPNIICDSQSFTTAALSEIPTCTSLKTPVHMAIDINPATNIVWAPALNASGYFLTIGTSLNGSELLNNLDVQNTLAYNPNTDFPSETEIYVTIIPYNRIGNAINCFTYNFITAAEAVLPECSGLITPFDGETNVPLSPVLEWSAVPNATGYRVSIGTSPFITDILDKATFFKTSTVVIDFEPNRTFFMTITPFNEAGDAIGCKQATFSTLLGCGPYYDALTGELQLLNPKLTFPETISICQTNSSSTISAIDKADGYRWYKLNGSGRETLISSLADVSITEIGEYSLEAYNMINNEGMTFECASTTYFEVTISAKPMIENVAVKQQGNFINYEIKTVINGNYEYALDNENGPFQESNKFENLPLKNHTVFVRDKDGCGTAQQIVEQDLTVNGFPNFFTPNGDGINDYWQFIPPFETSGNNVLTIWIFDKFGALLATIGPNSDGWNGSFNGRNLPESNYWFKAVSNKGQIINGYFSLKR